MPPSPTIWDQAIVKLYDPVNQHTHKFYCEGNHNSNDQGVNCSRHQLYQKALPFLKHKRNAIDVGCRWGEFTRYFTWTFNHVYCFDKFYKEFAMNISIEKKSVTHYSFYIDTLNKIDNFEYKDIDLIKVDTEPTDEFVLRGAENTIMKYRPVILIEDILYNNGTTNHNALRYLESINYEIGYELIETSKVKKYRNYVMVSKQQ